MVIEIVPLASDHLQDAAALAASRYRALREQVPVMPSRYEDPASLLPRLDDLQRQAPGVAAIEGGELVGFFGAWLLADFRGKRAVYSPEWGNAAILADSGRIYRAMYEQLSGPWLADGRTAHVLSLLAHDRRALQAWHWQGFGMMAVDAARDLSPIVADNDTVRIRRAALEDASQVWALDQALHQYLAGPPVFLYYGKDETLQDWERWLGNPGNALWLAGDDGEWIAYMMFGPANPDAATIVDDPGTASITGAFTRATWRGAGVGAALLNEGLAWARAAGYERCAVDFEPENIQGGRFWMRHFEPVCFSLARHVDERFVAAAT